MIERVQASEWMPPLNPTDRETHRKVRARLQEDQEDVVVAETCLLYGENDPLPVDDWVPSVFNENQGEAMYRQSMIHVQSYVGPLHQYFY